jgi:hypothetical protein
VQRRAEALEAGSSSLALQQPERSPAVRLRAVSATKNYEPGSFAFDSHSMCTAYGKT